ncbi:endonuclease I [Nocardioides ginsengisegetis]|uniref:Endonuclease I n=1 Tax=Nocardioides ginsengisegetis TaxID=661491 RepID=A0A7W3P9X9_9ACTN|nr:endonuclease [Nocardioides ginsengisegetis]MBA8803921.1 endonuclease I [Nocardioides ginsengisegetis]
MHLILGLRRRRASLVLSLLLLIPLSAAVGAPAQAAAPITVATARATQNGSSATVRGYVVGQPTSSTTVVTSGFPNDYALALADAPGVTDTSQMLYVQIPSAFRAAWGLRSNPSLLGKQIDVTGTLAAYFSRPGLTSGTAFALAGGGSGGGGGGAGGGTTAYDTTYWKNAVGKTGTTLESSLHTIISTGVTKLTYDQVWNALKVTDRDPANAAHVLCIYSGFSLPASDNGGGVDQWNREHVWAKSHGDFGTATGPGTDLHHLRPEDVTVNSARGNLDFDNGGTQNAEAPGNYADADSWEPRDAVKGDVARMIFYMAVRYDGGDGWPDLQVDDVVNNGTAPYLGRISVLLQWNAQDPPSSFEMHRNDVIYTDYQFNRNPFVDHPEWADSIW